VEIKKKLKFIFELSIVRTSGNNFLAQGMHYKKTIEKKYKRCCTGSRTEGEKYDEKSNYAISGIRSNSHKPFCTNYDYPRTTNRGDHSS
jgi:hypothetical protein